MALQILCLAMPIVAQDPWPDKGRTVNRLGRCDWVGPSVPVLAYRTRFEDTDVGTSLRSNPLLDAQGRIFIAGQNTIACLEASTGVIIWQRATPSVVEHLTLSNGRLFYGQTVGGNLFHCLDSATGQELWRVQTPPGPHRGQVVDSRSVLYYTCELQDLFARRAEDGSLVWSMHFYDYCGNGPSLTEDQALAIAAPGTLLQAHDTKDGSQRWSSPINRDIAGSCASENGRIYVGSSDWYLYCFDANTGDLVWRFFGERINRNTVALAHDGTIYFGTSSGGDDRLYAILPDGRERWRYYFEGHSPIDQPPTIGGDGTLYVSVRDAVGKCLAFSPNGQFLWSYDFPNYVYASPTIAPDGTLYVVCGDKYLYAFRDWQNAAPTDYQVRKGRLVSGTLADLASSDDGYFVLGSRPAGPVVGRSDTIEAEFGTTLLSQYVRSLEITVESKANAPSIVQEIWMKRRGSSTFDLVDSHTLGMLDTTVRINLPNPQDYVHQFDGRVTVKVVCRRTGIALAGEYQVSLDQIKVAAKFRMP